MKNIFLSIIFLFLLTTPAFCANKIVDSATNTPIGNAKITIPKYNYSTYTDSEGNFNLGNINSPTILSVQKEGYRPFSLTVSSNSTASKPLVMGIEKSDVSDIIIESGMVHIGDDNYSVSSANAGNFRLKSSGPSFSKEFILDSGNSYLVIGSILGIDTLMAKTMGQNRILNAYASPPEVYFNGAKIAEIQLNGDNQKIKLPSNLIRPKQKNQITIKAGRNLMQTAYIDYDDIEIANLTVLSD